MKIEWNKLTWYSKLSTVIFFLIILPIWLFYLNGLYQQTIKVENSLKFQNDNGQAESADFKNATYIINGESITLKNGKSESVIPESASKKVTAYFGNEASGDLNGDGLPDVAFIITQTDGGSGTFYYAVAALKTSGGYMGTNAVLLGDRIAPQTTEIKAGQLVVNYAERNPGEPMTTRPSLGVSKYLQVKGNVLIEITK